MGFVEQHQGACKTQHTTGSKHWSGSGAPWIKHKSGQHCQQLAEWYSLDRASAPPSLDTGGPKMHRRSSWALLRSSLLFLWWTVFSFNREATGLSVDGVALITFKNNLISDSLNALGNWNVSQATPCEWSGISCANVPQSTIPRVVGLSVIGKMLTGSLSPALGALDQLLRLNLQGNHLNGTIPPQLFNATSLHTILLGGNRIAGAIPDAIGRLSSLQTLDISSNRMLGKIPPSITKCRQLQTLVLNNNFFSGPIPLGLGTNLTTLEQLDLSANHLSGTVPLDLGKLVSLQGTLNLSYNHLSGTIPLSLGNLPYTVSLDLSHNNLSGRVPQDGSLAEQGPGPFLANPGLCGFPLTIACPVSPYVSPLPSLPTEGSSSSSKEPSQSGGRHNAGMSKKPNLSTGAIVAIAVGDAIGISMVAMLFVYMYWKARICQDKGCSSSSCSGKETRHGGSSRRQCFRAGSEDSEVSGSSEKGKEQGELVPLDKGFSFDMDELLRASAYVLGKSGQGIVYKVVLGNGSPVAVRRLGEGGSQRQKEFEAEVQAIGRVRHPNVVRLLAYYWADDEKLLIYDYIPSGSLATALHGNSRAPAARALAWPERLRIARGVARGLAYIHECSPRKYVHGDIKTAKILVDATWQAYVADFGLAKLATLAAPLAGPGPAPAPASASARLKNSSAPYRAPEALPDSKPSQKWDVFSYGVVLMELMSGRSPSGQMAAHGIDLVAWVRKAVDEDGARPPAQVLDPALAASDDPSGMAALLDLAMACTSPSPDQRPKMKSVADALDKLIARKT